MSLCYTETNPVNPLISASPPPLKPQKFISVMKKRDFLGRNLENNFTFCSLKCQQNNRVCVYLD